MTFSVEKRTEWFKNKEFIVLQEGPRIILREYGELALWLACPIFLLCPLAWALVTYGHRFQWHFSSLESTLLYVLSILAGIATLGLLWVGYRRTYVSAEHVIFHLQRQQLHVKKRVFTFKQIERIYVDVGSWMGEDIIRLNATISGEEICLSPGMTEKNRAVLEELAETLQSILSDVGVQLEADGIPDNEEANEDTKRRFLAALFCTLGVVWVLFGFLFLRSYVFEIDDRAGVLFWPFGFWLIILGCAEWWKLSWIHYLIEGPIRYQLLLAFLFGGSYLLICFRSF